jgi:host factor-I protein
MLTATAVKAPNIQDAFLTAARRTAAHVTVFLMNGYQMRGVISQFDPYVVVLMSDNKQQVIYKHAISTITPERTVELEN